MASQQPTNASGPATSGYQRYFLSESSDTFKYILPSDDQERDRLSLNSKMIVRLFDNKTILAPVTLKDGDAILDCGTGPGQWLLSVANDVPPTIRLHGIDLTPRMFPSPSLTPPNATFTTCSITSLPDNWTNAFSLVHQRLLSGSLRPEQWRTALAEIYRVLAPGGWIQFFEPHWILQSPSEAVRKHKANEMKNELCYKRQIVIDIVTYLESWLQQAGFVNVKLVEKRGLPLGSWGGEIGTIGLDCTMEFLRSLKEPIVREGGFGMVKSADEFDAAVDELKKICEETPESFYEYWLFVAQKPTEV